MTDVFEPGQEPRDEDGDEVEANGTTAAATPAASRQPPKKPAAKKPTTGVGSGEATHRPAGKIGHFPETVFKTKEVEFLWPEILVWLEENGKSPYDVFVRVVRLSPPPRETLGSSFDGSAVAGSAQGKMPGDAIVDYVTRWYHMASTSPGPAHYGLMFCWKANSKLFASGELYLPSQAECAERARLEVMRHQGQQAAGQHQMPPAQLPPQGGSGFGAGQPPVAVQQQWPQPPNMYSPFQPQQQQMPAQESDDVRRMRDENRLLKERLDAIDREKEIEREVERRVGSRGGQMERQPGAYSQRHGTGHQQPMQQQPSQQQTTAEVVRAILSELGIRPQGVGGPPQTPQSAVDNTQAGVKALQQLANTVTELKTVAESIDKIFDGGSRRRQQPAVAAGVGADVDQAAAAPAAEEEDDDVGFTVRDVAPDVKWHDGRPMKVAFDVNGKIDWTGVLLANPILQEQGMERVGGFLDRIGPALGFGRAPEQHLVQEQPKQLPAAPTATQEAEEETKEDEWSFD